MLYGYLFNITIEWALKKVVRQKEREIESLEKEVRTVQEKGRDLVNSREDG